MEVPVSTEVTQILDKVLSLCRLPFVTDFLFTPDPVADISILTAPVQTEHAIAARIKVFGTEATAQFAHIFDFASDFYFTSVPAFSIGPVTVGFCTQEPVKTIQDSLNTLPIGCERVQCNRYVRNDEKGVFLMLSENPTTGITEMDCMSHDSARKRTRICARFHTETLRSNVKTPNGTLNTHDVGASLAYLSVASERRACPLCGADDEGDCGCILPFMRPSHPLDFRNERRNMSLHTGRYEGGSTVRLFNTLQSFLITNLATKSIIKGSLDRNIITRMNKLAVQISMAKLSVSPFATAIPESALYLPVTTQSDVGSMLQDFCGTLEPPMWNGLFPSEMSVSKERLTMNSSLLQTSNPESPVSTSRLNLSGNIEQRDYLKEFVDTNTNGKSSEGNTSGSSTPMKNEKKGSDSDSGKMPDGKELKAELRRKRNREAAAKSNIKRKIRNNALRRDLAEASRKATELRAVEKRLREENVRLRVLANKNKVKISSHLTHIQIS